MLVIGIETSGPNGSVAVSADGECLGQRPLQKEGQRHAQSLVLELRELLQSCGIGIADVDAVAVSRGPGSFTGLRVGMVCAKTLAYATGCQFVAVDTFLAVARNCPPDVHDVWIVEDAQRGDLFAGRYQNRNDTWQQTETISIIEADSWLAARCEDEVITGRGLMRRELSTVARCLIDDSIIHPTAGSIAVLGDQALTSCTGDDAASPDFDFWKSVPFYMRPSAAEEQHEKREALQK